MAGREREYLWYLTGCERLGQKPLDEAEFDVRWQEFEDHAERLKTAQSEGKMGEVEASLRTAMQRRVQEDPFVKAVLVGMAEHEQES